MSEPIDLPPEIEQVADLLSKQRPEVRELFYYALVLAMIGDEEARIGGTRNEGDHKYLTVQAIAGDVFKRNEIEEASCLTSRWSRAVLRGAVGKVPMHVGNSLAAYSTHAGFERWTEVSPDNKVPPPIRHCNEAIYTKSNCPPSHQEVDHDSIQRRKDG